MGALGKIVETRGDVVLVENGTGGRGWLLRDGAVIVFSDDVEALSRGARLAEEARHPVAEDVTAVLYPDAIARANGTDVKTALALGHRSQLQAAQGTSLGGRQLESIDEMVSLEMGDTEAMSSLGLAIDAGKGLSLRDALALGAAASKLEALAKRRPALRASTWIALLALPSARHRPRWWGPRASGRSCARR